MNSLALERLSTLPSAEPEGMTSLLSSGYYRYHPGFSPAEVRAIEWHRFRSGVNQPFRLWSLAGAEGSRALALVHRLDWDSRHFGREMGRLLLCHDNSIDTASLARLVRQVVSDATDSLALAHISLDADIDDYALFNAAFMSGFLLMDLKRTYCANRLRDDIDFIRASNRVRPFRPADRDAVRALAAQVRFASRFTRDPRLDRSKADSLYASWFEQLMDGAGSKTNVLVYERQGRVQACGGVGEMDFADAGVDHCIRQGSLYAGLPQAVGAYIPVLYQLTREAIASHGLVETTVSLNNPVTARVLEGFRSNKGSVTRYALRFDVSDGQPPVAHGKA